MRSHVDVRIGNVMAMKRLKYCSHSRIQWNGKWLPKFFFRLAFFSSLLSLSIAEGDGIVVAFFVTFRVGREIRRKSEHVTFRMKWNHFDDKLINNRYFLWIAANLFLLFYSVRSSKTNTIHFHRIHSKATEFSMLHLLGLRHMVEWKMKCCQWIDKKSIIKIKIDINLGKLMGKFLTLPVRLAVHLPRFRGWRLHQPAGVCAKNDIVKSYYT